MSRGNPEGNRAHCVRSEALGVRVPWPLQDTEDWALRVSESALCIDHERSLTADGRRVIAEKIARRVGILKAWNVQLPEATEVAFARTRGEAHPVSLVVAAPRSLIAQTCDMFDRRLVFDNMPVLDWFSPAGPDGRRMDLRQPRGARKREREWRHNFGFLIPCHCVEVQIMSARTVAGKFPLCDGYFGRVEVPFASLRRPRRLFSMPESRWPTIPSNSSFGAYSTRRGPNLVQANCCPRLRKGASGRFQRRYYAAWRL